MEQLANIAFTLGVVAYSVAGTLFFLELARPDGLPLARKWAPRALALGVGLHASQVVLSSFVLHVCPVTSINFALSLGALVAAAAYLRLRPRGLHAMGVFVAPMALTFLVAAQFVGDVGVAHELSTTLLAMHITANLVGVGFVLLAGGASFFYLLQERRLKSKKLGMSRGRLPALSALDSTEHRLLLVGFPLLTFGAVTGGIFFSELGPIGSASFARAIVGYFTWAVVAGVLLLRTIGGWRGRKSAYGTLAGVFGVALLLALYALRPLLGGGA